MKQWLIKAGLLGLVLFFTYIYCYQQLGFGNNVAQASTPVIVKHVNQSVDQMKSRAIGPSNKTDVYWKKSTTNNEGVIPKMTKGAGNVAAGIIKQGVVVVASLVYAFMSLFV